MSSPFDPIELLRQLVARDGRLWLATGRGIADAREAGCTLLGGGAGAASCNGPRPAFDPFQPLLTATENGQLLIPEGTRLPFRVCTGAGCPPDPTE